MSDNLRDGTMRVARPFYGSTWHDGDAVVPMLDKYTGDHLGEVRETPVAAVAEALASLEVGQRTVKLSPYERSQLLVAASRALETRFEEFANCIVDDTGFTIGDATLETKRAIQTLILTAEETKRLVGEMIPFEGSPAGAGRVGYTTFHPLGVVCAITPFNSPLNTLLHKVAPALGAGNAVAVKPAELTPFTAHLLVELLLEVGFPPELLAFLPGKGETIGQALLESPIPDFYAFTGSTEVGTHIRNAIGIRASQLEMGSIASTLICDDANLERAVPMCVDGAFRKAGQVCTSIQRLYVQEGCYDEVADQFIRVLSQRQVGDPRDEKTFVGPLISPQESERVSSWVAESVANGSKVIYESKGEGVKVGPTVLGDVAPTSRLMNREIFGPVVLLQRFSDFETALADANNTPFGLAAGIFTRDIERGLRAAEVLNFGSVHINATSSSRIDLMPFSGSKASGLGTEGPHYAIREMSQERLVTIGQP
jgi:succinate-semialdehyde dehydrogenase/glutarate-semialdehyde dehydrogenase